MADPKTITSKHAGFIRAVQIGTGLSFRTVFTWVALEDGPVDNPLNIGPGKRYGSAGRASVATIALLRSDITNARGYATILSSAGQKDSNQLKAIAFSAWVAGKKGVTPANVEYGKRLVSTYSTYFPVAPGSGFGDWVKQTVTDPGQSIADAGSWYGDKLGALLSGSLWIRILMVVIGAILALGGLAIFTKELAR